MRPSPARSSSPSARASAIGAGDANNLPKAVLDLFVAHEA